MSDTILERLKIALDARQARGLETYGTTLDTANLSRQELLAHLLDELLDAAFYTLAISDEFEQKGETGKNGG